jgi:phage recombination protein Bet
MTTALTTLTNKLAQRLEMGDGTDLIETLKATAFKGNVSDAQMTALMIVANQYCLNPWTKEIYAYPDKNNGIVPVVGVDGWARIINTHPELDGIEFNYSEATLTHKNKTCHEWVECVLYRKDRSRPTVIRERFEEVVRSVSFATPWDSHPNRMHRHKALIQCARIAFGFSGIYDDDEAARIVDAQGSTKQIDPATGEITQPQQRPALPAWPDDAFKTQFDRWSKAVAAGFKTSEEILTLARSKGSLTPEQETQIKAIKKVDESSITDVQPKSEPQTTPATDNGWDDFQNSK